MHLWQMLTNWPIPSKWLDRKFVHDAQSAGKPMRHRQHREKEKIQCHLSVRESEFSLISPNHTDAWAKQRIWYQFRVWHRVLGCTRNVWLMRGPGTSPYFIPNGPIFVSAVSATVLLASCQTEELQKPLRGRISLGKSTVETDWPLQPKLVGSSTLDFPNSSLECGGGSPINLGPSLSIIPNWGGKSNTNISHIRSLRTLHLPKFNGWKKPFVKECDSSVRRGSIKLQTSNIALAMSRLKTHGKSTLSRICFVTRELNFVTVQLRVHKGHSCLKMSICHADAVDMNGPWPTPKTELVNVSARLGFGSVIWLNYLPSGNQTWKWKNPQWPEGFFMGASWNIKKNNGRFAIAMAMITANQTVQTNSPNLAISGDVVTWGHCMSVHVIACHCMSLHPDCRWKPDVILLFVGKIPILFLQYTHQVTTVSCLSPCLIENYDVYHFFPGKCQFWLVNSPLKQHDHNMIFHGMRASLSRRMVRNKPRPEPGDK